MNNESRLYKLNAERIAMIEEILSSINVGDEIEWTDGLGAQQRARVFLSKRTSKLAIKLTFSETSVYHMVTLHGRALIVHRAVRGVKSIGNSPLGLAVRKQQNGRAS